MLFCISEFTEIPSLPASDSSLATLEPLNRNVLLTYASPVLFEVRTFNAPYVSCSFIWTHWRLSSYSPTKAKIYFAMGDTRSLARALQRLALPYGAM